MNKVLLIVAFSIILISCNSPQLCGMRYIHQDEGEVIRRDEYAVFKFSVYFDKLIKDCETFPQPKEVKLLAGDKVYIMKLYEKNEPTANSYYKFMVDTPRNEFEEGTIYKFSFLLSGETIETDDFILKYEN